MTPDVTVSKGGPELVDRLEGLWLELFEHHKAAAPHLRPFVTSQQSWAARRRLYERLPAIPDAFALLAERGRVPWATRSSTCGSRTMTPVDDLVIMVLPTNTGAVDFYTARGFEPQMLHLWHPPGVRPPATGSAADGMLGA